MRIQTLFVAVAIIACAYAMPTSSATGAAKSLAAKRNAYLKSDENSRAILHIANTGSIKGFLMKTVKGDQNGKGGLKGKGDVNSATTTASEPNTATPAI